MLDRTPRDKIGCDVICASDGVLCHSKMTTALVLESAAWLGLVVITNFMKEWFVCTEEKTPALSTMCSYVPE